MVPSISRKTAERCVSPLHRILRKDIRPVRPSPSRSCKPADREATQSRLILQTLGTRSYFNQVRIIIHVKPATPNGTIPTSRFLPTHGRAFCFLAAELWPRNIG